MIAVTFALPAESSEFVRLIRVGKLHGHEVRVLHTGVGERTARARVIEFLAKEKPRMLISSGFAGALTDELKPADIFIAENFSAAALIKVQGAQVGRLETVGAIMDSLGERTAFAQRTGAQAVDMETKFIAEACTRTGVPLLSLRAISDSPAAPFEIPAKILFDIERQRTSAAALALYLAQHPSAIGKLIRLAKQVSLARKALTTALDNFLRGLDVH